MKRNLLLWICLCIANIAFSQTTHLTDLGVLATVSVDLNAPDLQRFVFSVPEPPEGASPNAEIYGPGQPRIISYGSGTWQISVSGVLLDDDSNYGEAVLELCVDKWYDEKNGRYVISISNTDTSGRYWRCYYEIRLLWNKLM